MIFYFGRTSSSSEWKRPYFVKLSITFAMKYGGAIDISDTTNERAA